MLAQNFSAISFLICFVFCILVQGSIDAQETRTSHEVERQVFKLLQEGNVSEALAMKEELARVSSSPENLNAFAILDDGFVWRIHGICDPNQLFGSIEYLAGTEAKAYEAILVIENDQVERVHQIADVVKTFRENNSGTVQIQFAWSKDNKLHVFDISELFKNTTAEKLDEFLHQDRKSDFGWKSTHLEGDLRKWPSGVSNSTMIVTVHR